MEKTWFLLNCHIQHFQRVALQISLTGVEIYYPQQSTVTPRKDCKSFRKTTKPLFPGYLFTRFDPEEIHPTAITDIPGAGHFVKFNNQLGQVHEDEINALKCALLLRIDPACDHIECRNVPPALLAEIQRIYMLDSAMERQVALLSLLEKKGTQEQLIFDKALICSVCPPAGAGSSVERPTSPTERTHH